MPEKSSRPEMRAAIRASFFGSALAVQYSHETPPDSPSIFLKQELLARLFERNMNSGFFAPLAPVCVYCGKTIYSSCGTDLVQEDNFTDGGVSSVLLAAR
jgi:hypothetical protein